MLEYIVGHLAKTVLHKPVRKNYANIAVSELLPNIMQTDRETERRIII